jgi:multisubunit Na+/H+ antiporter MnhF subunit
VTVVTTIVLAMVAVAAVLSLMRELRPAASLPDRLVGLDSLLVIIAAGIAVWAARTDSGTYLDVMVVVALVGFTARVTVAVYVERRGSR